MNFLFDVSKCSCFQAVHEYAIGCIGWVHVMTLWQSLYVIESCGCLAKLLQTNQNGRAKSCMNVVNRL